MLFLKKLQNIGFVYMDKVFKKEKEKEESTLLLIIKPNVGEIY
jgi:hypothetical protein